MFVVEYFDKLTERIENSPMVSAKNLTIEARSLYTGIIRGEVFFLDGSILYFTEVVDVELRIDRVKYRYQYQQLDTSERIFRYDNTKHHPALATFPHHKHVGAEKKPDTVLPSRERFLSDIFDEIEACLFDSIQ